MKQNKLKMKKLTEAEKKAIRREQDYQIASDRALIGFVLLAVVLIIAIVMQFL